MGERGGDGRAVVEVDLHGVSDGASDGEMDIATDVATDETRDVTRGTYPDGHNSSTSGVVAALPASRMPRAQVAHLGPASCHD